MAVNHLNVAKWMVISIVTVDSLRVVGFFSGNPSSEKLISVSTLHSAVYVSEGICVDTLFFDDSARE